MNTAVVLLARFFQVADSVHACISAASKPPVSSCTISSELLRAREKRSCMDNQGKRCELDRMARSLN